MTFFSYGLWALRMDRYLSVSSINVDSQYISDSSLAIISCALEDTLDNSSESSVFSISNAILNNLVHSAYNALSIIIPCVPVFDDYPYSLSIGDHRRVHTFIKGIVDSKW